MSCCSVVKNIDECIAFINNRDPKTNAVQSKKKKKKVSRSTLLLYGWLREIAPHITISPIFSVIYTFYPRAFKCIGIGENSYGCLGLGHPDPVPQFEAIPIPDINPVINHINCYNNAESIIIHDKLTNKIYVSGCNIFGNCGIDEKPPDIDLSKIDYSSPNFSVNSILTLHQGSRQVAKVLTFTECTIADNTDIINIVGCGKLLLVTDKGLIYGAGDNSSYMLGQETNEEEYKVIYLPQVTKLFLSKNMKIEKITCGMEHTLFLLENHTIFSCGSNEWSQCGVINTNENEEIEYPVLVEHIPPVYDICCSQMGNLCLCAGTDLFNVWVFGLNASGELGRLTKKDRKTHIHKYGCVEKWKAITVPTVNFDLKQFGIKKVVAGERHSICIDINGKCWTMGSNKYGTLGINEKEKTDNFEVFYPQQLTINEEICAAFCGKYHSVLLTESNEIYTFGCNANAQCSAVSKEKNLYKPYHLTREEIGIQSEHFIENILCVGGSTIFFIDTGY